MAKFELHYNQSASYENKVEVDIRLETRPTKVEYQDMLDAIETLNKVAQKYVIIPPKEEKK
jgi:hypothetical protein